MSDVGGFIADMARRQRKGETFETPAYDLNDGWIADSDPWVYVSQNKFKIVGKNVITRFSVGCKLSFTNTTAKHAYAVAAVLSGSDTLVTTAGNALVAGAISLPHYSYASNPQGGFTHWFAWIPTPVGYSTNPPSVCRFSISGRTCYCQMREGGTGVSNATTATYTLPVVPSSSMVGPVGGRVPAIVDNGTTLNGGMWHIAAAVSTVTFYKTEAGAAWTASGAKSAFYATGIEFFYEI